MAAGDTLLEFTALANEPPAASFATFDTRNSQPVIDYDDTAEENGIFSGVMPRNYAGGGVTFYIHWAATSAVAGTTVWQTALERLGTVQDMDSDSFATGNNGTTLTQGTAGLLNITNIAHTDGAQMDSIAVGEGFRVRLSREVADAQDSMVGDAELRFIEMKET